MGLRTVILMSEGQVLCYAHPCLSDAVVAAGLVAGRAAVILCWQYLSPHCWMLQEPVLPMEEPGRGLCILGVCLQPHASLKDQGHERTSCNI